MLKRPKEADRTIFVGNLDCNVKEEILYELFLQAGPVTKVSMAKDKDGNLKSFGFVCFKHAESVHYAISLLNGIRLFGRPIRIHYRIGSSYSCDESNVFQGPGNGFMANQAGHLFSFGFGFIAPVEPHWTSPGIRPLMDYVDTDVRMPEVGESFTPGYPMPGPNYNHFSEANYFQGMMNQFLAFPQPAFGAAAQEPPPYRTTPPWTTDIFPPYNETAENFNVGPRSQRRNLKVLYDYKANKRRREASSSDTDNDDLEAQKSKSSHKLKRKKSKRRKL